MTGTDLRTTARVTGAAYLCLALFGALGFLFIRDRLYVDGDAAQTAANLVAHEGLARLGIAADLMVVVAQAVAACWFFLLFRAVHAAAAGAIAAFGLVNSVTVTVATAFSATALEEALRGGGDAALLYHVNGEIWQVGDLFFGLWLIPMGWLVVRSGLLPRLLGWILLVGGACYIGAAFAAYLLPAAVADVLVLPATIGEFWMIGYLLTAGVRTDGPKLAASQSRL